jgi:hypothetical protein
MPSSGSEERRRGWKGSEVGGLGFPPHRPPEGRGREKGSASERLLEAIGMMMLFFILL